MRKSEYFPSKPNQCKKILLADTHKYTTEIFLNLKAFLPFLFFFTFHEIFCENLRIIFVLFYNVHKENIFTINLEDGHEAPSKASFHIFL